MYLSLLLNGLAFQPMFSDLLHSRYILIATQAINDHINGYENLLQSLQVLSPSLFSFPKLAGLLNKALFLDP